MPLDVGYIHCGGDDLYVRVFYQQGFVPNAMLGQTYLDAPLVNNSNPDLGPTGYCLLVVNNSGETGTATVFNSLGVMLIDNVLVPVGSPVLAGNARSRTAVQVALLGWRTRGDVGQISME